MTDTFKCGTSKAEIEGLFAIRMKAARKALGMSQRAFADRFSEGHEFQLDASAVTRIETGQRSVGLAEAVWIANFLNIPVFDESDIA